MAHASSVSLRLGAGSVLAGMIGLLGACSAPDAPAPAVQDAAPAASAPARDDSDDAYALVTIPVDATAPAGLREAIQQGRSAGAITYALWLDATHTDKAGFASTAILGFDNEQALATWQEASAASLAAPTRIRQADRLFHLEKDGRDSSIAVFQANYMVPKVSPEAFADFSHRYMQKYLDLQYGADILTAYAMYVERPDASGPGRAFMMREHRDQATFDDRNSTKDRLRDELMARDADYKQLEDTAIAYRSHESSTRAKVVEL